METQLILDKLTRIEKYLVGNKKILNVEELADYTGFKKSYLYQLVHNQKIPYSKPNGKMLFFERKKIDQWLLSNNYKSNLEINKEAIEIVAKRKLRF